MGITDNCGYVEQATAGILGLLITQSTASSESKFLSLFPDFQPINNAD